MAGRLAGKVALVTGAASGIGAATVVAMAREGAVVVGADLAAPAGGIVLDVTDEGQWQAGIDGILGRHGRLDILVNNAGIFAYGPIEDTTLADIDRMLAIHVRAVYVAAQAAVRHMGDGGRIVSIGSCLAHRVPHAGVTLYAMSKSALTGFTKGLARDLGPRGITVNVVDPGPTDTDMNPADGPGAPDQRALLALDGYGAADDVAAAVAHLAGPGGRFITGASIAVDGGYEA